jgi:hypothetical protein
VIFYANPTDAFGAFKNVRVNGQIRPKNPNFLKNPNNQDIKNRKYTVKWRGCGFGVVKNHTIRLCSLKLS